MLHIHFQLHGAEVVPTAPLLMPNGAEHRPTCTLRFLRDVSGETQPVRKCNPKKINLGIPPAQTSSLTSLSVLISALTSYNFGSYWWGCRKKSNFLNPAKFDLFTSFLYHSDSYLVFKGYSKRDTWAMYYCMMVVKQPASSRAKLLCSGKQSANTITSTPLLP